MRIECRTARYGETEARLYVTTYGGREHVSATMLEAILYGMGYGSDQAAELRYLMKKKMGEKPNEA